MDVHRTPCVAVMQIMQLVQCWTDVYLALLAFDLRMASLLDTGLEEYASQGCTHASMPSKKA